MPRRNTLLALATLALTAAPLSALADKASECTKAGLCYCTDTAVRAAIDEKVAQTRAQMAEARKSGKAVGYLSAPVSTAGGGYSGLNGEVANGVKAALEKRFGPGRLFLTDPALELPPAAGGAEYMLMWTMIFEGKDGLGEDFDFAYFTGPQDFSRHLGFTGDNDMARIDALFDEKIKSDAGLQKAVQGGRLTRETFRTYYAFKASVAFSRGSSDEWNIVSALNERRRADKNYGIPNQIAVLYNGGGLQPGSVGARTADGYAGKCAAP